MKLALEFELTEKTNIKITEVTEDNKVTVDVGGIIRKTMNIAEGIPDEFKALIGKAVVLDLDGTVTEGTTVNRSVKKTGCFNKPLSESKFR